MMNKRRVCAVFYYGKNFHICPTDLPRITGYIAGNILNLILKERSDCENFYRILSPERRRERKGEYNVKNIKKCKISTKNV